MREEAILSKNRVGWPLGRPNSPEQREKNRVAHLKYWSENEEVQVKRRALTALIEAGATNKAAGLALGIGKSAVSGILHRMEKQGIIVVRPPKPVKAKAPKKPVQFRSWKPTPPQPRRRIEHPPMAPVTLLERTGCAFPINDGGPFLFCNNELHFPTSYCLFHGSLMVRE